jgi:hypothetical protein
VTFRTLHRVVCLFAVGFVASGCVLDAAWPARGESSKGLAKTALRRVGVEELQRILAEDKGKADVEVARQLSGLELTERVSDAELKLLEKDVPGAKSQWALIALADAAVFLGPAAADVLSQAAPDLSEQRRMLALTMEYLSKTLPKLPDFYATQTTVRFEDGWKLKRDKSGDDFAWRVAGSSKAVVAYRDGKEVVDTREQASPRADDGLITRGVFGPILSTVVADAAHGEMTWERWERGGDGTLAVFRYRVPENQSHYSVAYHAAVSDKGDTKQADGYHGEVAIDPATGTILRLTVQADLTPASPILRGDIMVEYGPVELGGRMYTCPLRSVSISVNAVGFLGNIGSSPWATLLNDVTFGEYHLFRSESRILNGTIPAPAH